MHCACTVQKSDKVLSFREWMMLVACLLLSQILCLPSRSQAMSFRLSDLGLHNDQSYRLRTDKNRAARDALLASNTFVRYVQVWMLHHTISAPMKIQAKVWSAVLWQAVQTATGLLTGACFATYVTLKLSHAETLTPDCYVYLLGMHFSCNFLLARLHLEYWQAGRLLSSTNGGMSPVRQLYKEEQLDAVLAKYASRYLQWCLCVGIGRRFGVENRKHWLFPMDLLCCTLILWNFCQVMRKGRFSWKYTSL